ncbi:MAG: hypothetical protein FWD73_14050 [Polyangiaceae bacterium]|nr:hypothetical protein [Polyangiaceae bacterium]
MGRVVGVVGVAAMMWACVLSSSCVSGSGAMPFIAVTPEDARLAATSNAVTERVGHALEYDIDPALLKEHEGNAANMVSDALETVARGIDAARESDPDATDQVCAVWDMLRISVDEKAREPYARFDVSTKTMTLWVPTRATTFAHEWSVTQALLTAALPTPPPTQPAVSPSLPPLPSRSL